MQEGKLTTEEFVIAGDALIEKCPTWSWETGKNLNKSLPDDKQFLIIREVPCKIRAKDLVDEEKNHIEETEDDDGWVIAAGKIAGAPVRGGLVGVGLRQVGVRVEPGPAIPIPDEEPTAVNVCSYVGREVSMDADAEINVEAGCRDDHADCDRVAANGDAAPSLVVTTER